MMFDPRDHQPAPSIISASRRTDIPAFYMPWLMNRLREGSASYPNPFGGQVQTVSLKPEDVHSIVFWSKHYGAFLHHVDALEAMGYPFYCHYTITGAPRALEPHVPGLGLQRRGLPGAGGADQPAPRPVALRSDRVHGQAGAGLLPGALRADRGRAARRDHALLLQLRDVLRQGPAPPAPGGHPLRGPAAGHQAPPGAGAGGHRGSAMGSGCTPAARTPC